MSRPDDLLADIGGSPRSSLILPPPAAPPPAPAAVPGMPKVLTTDGARGPLSGSTWPGYEIGDLLGSGGMAEVYRAWQTAVGRIVALKVLSAGVSEGGLHARFAAEAAAAARVDSPHVVRIIDSGTHAGRMWLALEYVAGRSLAELMRARGHAPLPPMEAGRLVLQAAQGLAAVHARQLVHRDLKPGNLLMAQDGTLKVADFGLVRFVDGRSLTRTGTVLGTPQYMPPEQGRGLATTPAGDVYSLGVVLYELLAGRPPFDGETSDALIFQHNYAEPRPLAQPAGAIPKDLLAVCLTCLQKDPARRYLDADALAGDLARVLDGLAPVAAVSGEASTGAEAALRRAAGRRRWLPAAAVIIIIIISAIIAISWTYRPAPTALPAALPVAAALPSPALPPIPPGRRLPLAGPMQAAPPIRVEPASAEAWSDPTPALLARTAGGSGRVLRVSAAATGHGDGSSWADACPTLQAALARAAAGDQVWIAQGSYVPGTTSADTFTIPRSVAVYGGFLGGETELSQRRDDPALVVISGEIGAEGYDDNISTLITMPGSGRVDTLTVSGANYARQDAKPSPFVSGAAGLHCTATPQQALDVPVKVALVRCRFVRNRARGKQVVVVPLNCSAVIDRCEFAGNDRPSADPDPDRVAATVACDRGSITRCVFVDGMEAGKRAIPLRHALLRVGEDASIANCVFLGCRQDTAVHAAGLRVSVKGCVFLDGEGVDISANCFSSHGSCLVRGCILGAAAQAGPFSVDEGNWRIATDGDPRFADPAAPAGADGVWFTADDGLRLRPDSPCIDFVRFATATTDTGVPVVDILGLPRPQGRDPDCGAYEFAFGNLGPRAIPCRIMMGEDIPTLVTFDGSDPDGDSLTAIVTALPAQGTLRPTSDGLTPSGPAITEAQLPWTVTDPQRRAIYVPEPFAFGDAMAKIAFAVSDGRITSPPVQLSIDVSKANHPPTIDQFGDTTIAEDSGQLTIRLSGISAGTPELPTGSPGYEGETVRLSATSSDPALIPALTVSAPSVEDSLGRAPGPMPTSTAQLSLAPAPNASGRAVITVTAKDVGGTRFGGRDTTVMSFTVTVTPVNDPPTMDPIADLTVAAGAAEVAVALTGLSPGPADESGQTLTVRATSADPALVQVAALEHDAGAATATLRLAIPTQAPGTATILVTASDGDVDPMMRILRVTVVPPIGR